MKRCLTSFLFVLAFFLFARPATALTTRTERNSILKVDQPIHDTAFLVGSAISVDAPITGDLLCAAQTVVINAPVAGDVLCAAQTLTVNAPISGSIRSMSQNLTVNSMVGRNVMALAQQLSLSPKSTVNGEVTVWSQLMTMDGTVMQGIYGGGEQVNVNGKVGGPINIQVGALHVGKTASIASGITYHSRQDASIDLGSTVSGTVQKEEPTNQQRREEQYPQEQWMARFLRAVIIHGLIGAALLYFFPIFMKKALIQVQADRTQNIIAGLLFILVTPILLVCIALTIIGIPITIIGFIIWGVLLVLSQVLVAVAFGERTMQQQLSKQSSLYVPMLVGVIIVQFFMSIPFVGSLVTLAVTVIGSGAFVRLWLNRRTV